MLKNNLARANDDLSSVRVILRRVYTTARVGPDSRLWPREKSFVSVQKLSGPDQFFDESGPILAVM